ncbi:MAG: ABC transporter ATP-binding protein [Chloroflexi bacterium]|nr:ABC transporter ATP-binding protein [Chloroflexota bacterium]
MPAASLAIETDGLTRYYGTRRVVGGVSLAVPRGACFGLLGASGAGKTTLLRMVLGQVRPSSGSGWILGHDIVRERQAIRPLVGVAIDPPRAIGRLALRHSLELRAVASSHSDPARVDEVLELTALQTRAAVAVRSVTRGERRRLAVAAALLRRPVVLFLDEPAWGLNTAEVAELLRVLDRLNAAGLTIVLTSRLLTVVEQICTHAAILHAGQLLAQGTLAELCAGDDSLLVTAEPLPIVAAVAAHLGYPSQPAGQGALRVAATPEAAPRLIAALVSAGARVFAVTPQHRSLAQRFPELVEAR